MNGSPRIIGALVGDIVREPGARTKYGLFFEAVGEHFPLVDVYDASLRGMARMVNAIQVVHPNTQRWKERFYQNLPAYRARSRQAANYVRSMQGRADLVLQVGVLFDPCWNGAILPNLIYTDYTMHLSAQKPGLGRSPLTHKQCQAWIELERRAFDRAIHVCTRSKRTRDSIVNDYGIAAERVTVIGGGVNFRTLPDIVPAVARQEPTVLFIGKDFYRKGGDVLLRAFSKTRQQLPKARLLLLTGESIPDNLPLDGVELIKPTWDRNVIGALYRRADVFVLPSRLETWGDVLIEAMTYGLPCIGVTGEAMDEIIEDGATGLTVPPDDADALAAALTCLLSNRSLCLQWGKKARRRVEQEYTWDHVGARLARVIEASAELLGKPVEISETMVLR